MNLLLGLIEFVKVDRILKNSCDNNEDFCEFHQRFLAVLNSLPSTDGFNDFSISKSGSVKKFAKVDWIMDAIVSITENMGILQPEYNSNTEATQNSFLQNLEQFNFGEFFKNTSKLDDNIDASTEISLGENENFNLQETINIYERLVKIMDDFLGKINGKETSARFCKRRGTLFKS